jgi:hypothetical protein
MNIEILTIISISVAIILLYIIYPKPKALAEKYSIVLGKLAPQSRFYNKCINECERNKSGDTGTGQFKWLCTRKCEDVAAKLVNMGEYAHLYNTKKWPLTDLTAEEYQRNNPLWDSEFLESDYCLKDMKTLCQERYCPYSNHPNCVRDCVRVKGVDCGGPVTA